MTKLSGLLAPVLLAALFFAAPPTAAQVDAEGFVISDIRVDGLQRISAGTVFNLLPLRVGDRLQPRHPAEIIRKLFASGFFRDVQVERDGDVLVILVVERPSISQLDFVGNKVIKDDKIKEVTDVVELSEGRIFNQAVLDKALQELRSLYFARGYYSVDMEGTTTPLAENQVAVTITVFEGKPAKIRKITIVGNELFEDKELLGEMTLRARRRFSFLSSRDLYAREKLAADLETIQSFYQDRGFLGFEIIATQVSITPDKREIYITISLKEGGRYTIAGYTISGDTIFPEEEIRRLVTVEEGQVFSQVRVSESREAITEKLTDAGYAFAAVTAEPVEDEETSTATVEFVVDPGPRVYVRRITITGNHTTHDHVARREFRQFEGGWYSAAKVRRSRIRLQRLGYFESINIETPRVPDTVDQVDIVVTVTERPTGSFVFGVGYADDDGVLLRGSVTQENLFGSGKELSLSLEDSEVTDNYSLRFRDPYYTQDGVSRAFSIGRREVDASEASSSADYVLDSTSTDMVYEIPVTEFSFWRIGGALEEIHLETVTNTPQRFRDVINATPDGNQFGLDTGFIQDTRDSRIYPTTGVRSSIKLEAALPGSDFEYYKATLGSVYYWRMPRRFVGRAFGEVSYGNGYGGTSDLPFFENYFVGGPGSLRGYDSRSLGPQLPTGADPASGPRTCGASGVTCEAVGGNKRLIANLELLMPFPGSQTQDKRIGVFVDAGQVYGEDQSIGGDLRYASGVAFYWFSPLGPISLSYGLPLNKKTGDDVERFQFTFGVDFR